MSSNGAAGRIDWTGLDHTQRNYYCGTMKGKASFRTSKLRTAGRFHLMDFFFVWSNWQLGYPFVDRGLNSESSPFITHVHILSSNPEVAKMVNGKMTD